VYTGLSTHLEYFEGKLLQKEVGWKHDLADSVAAAHLKLSSHYSKTNNKEGEIFNWVTVLDFSQNLELYKTLNFITKNLNKYNRSFRHEVGKGYETPQPIDDMAAPNHFSLNNMDIADMPRMQQHVQATGTWKYALVVSYLLSEQIDDKDLLAFWACHEREYPRLLQMAKDVLAVPGSGVSAEHIFLAA
jgi:hypothetical protein